MADEKLTNQLHSDLKRLQSQYSDVIESTAKWRNALNELTEELKSKTRGKEISKTEYIGVLDGKTRQRLSRVLREMQNLSEKSGATAKQCHVQLRKVLAAMPAAPLEMLNYNNAGGSSSLQSSVTKRKASETDINDQDEESRKRSRIASKGLPRKGPPMSNAAGKGPSTGSTAQKGPFVSQESHAARDGEVVAAVDPRSKDFILARVIQYLVSKNRYELEDADPSLSPSANRRRFLAPQDDVVKLNQMLPGGVKTYPKGTHVLALYPSTSSLYPAVIVSNPRFTSNENMYTVVFDDDGDEEGEDQTFDVDVHHVALLPESLEKNGRKNKRR